MSNSNLISYTDTGHGKYNIRTSPITKITIHHLAAVGDLSKITSTIRNNDVSWNYGIARNGVIGLFVPEEYRSWSTGNIVNDSQSINIVVCNSNLSPNWEVSEAAIGSLKKLCYDICVRNRIARLTFTGRASSSNLTLHRWFDERVLCPGKTLLSNIPNIVDEVNSWLDSYNNTSHSKQEDLFKFKVQVAVTPSGKYLSFDDVTAIEMNRYNAINIQSKPNATDNNSSPLSILNDLASAAEMIVNGSGDIVNLTPDTLNYKIEWIEVDGASVIDFPILDYQLEVNRKALHPYIVTISENTKSVDYSMLTSIGAIGVLLYGGTLFDDNHFTHSYQPARLDNQVSQANNAKFPFGLYVKVRSNTVAEARTELHGLYQVVSKYPPQLGIWLQLEMNASSTKVCDDILMCYYQAIQKWNLHSKCGLYVTRQQLSKISWSTFKQYFLLNLVDHVTDTTKLDEVLTESFFNI